MKDKFVDSGKRTDFGNGGVRETGGKGRFDLMPLNEVYLFEKIQQETSDCKFSEDVDNVIYYLSLFQQYGDTDRFQNGGLESLQFAIEALRRKHPIWKDNTYQMWADLAFVFEKGAEKYPDVSKDGKICLNAMKGLPVNCFLDSATRHYMKYKYGMVDEPHDAMFVWNVIMCLWTIRNLNSDNICHEAFRGEYNERV